MKNIGAIVFLLAIGFGLLTWIAGGKKDPETRKLEDESYRLSKQAEEIERTTPPMPDTRFVGIANEMSGTAPTSSKSGLPSAKEMAYIDNESRALRARLKDPDAAKFSGRYVSRKAGPPVVCGYVNSKNSFGAYGGAQRFIGASGAGYSLTEEDMAPGEMDQLWARLC